MIKLWVHNSRTKVMKTFLATMLLEIFGGLRNSSSSSSSSSKVPWVICLQIRVGKLTCLKFGK